MVGQAHYSGQLTEQPDSHMQRSKDAFTLTWKKKNAESPRRKGSREEVWVNCIGRKETRSSRNI